MRVAIATVIRDATFFCTWIDLDELYILDPKTLTLSPIALEIWPKMSFFADFGLKIRHFDAVTIATGWPISFWLVNYLRSHSGYMIRAFNGP